MFLQTKSVYKMSVNCLDKFELHYSSKQFVFFPHCPTSPRPPLSLLFPIPQPPSSCTHVKENLLQILPSYTTGARKEKEDSYLDDCMASEIRSFTPTPSLQLKNFWFATASTHLRYQQEETP